MSIAERDQALASLNDISQEFIWNYFHTMENEEWRQMHILPQDFLVQAKLMTLGNQLAKAQGIHLPHLCSENLDLALEGKYAYFHTYSPEWDHQLLALKILERS